MPSPQLVVIAGAQARSRKPKRSPAQEDIVKRWRMDGALAPCPQPMPEPRDVIPLLDGWIRRLERQAVAEPAARTR